MADSNNNRSLLGQCWRLEKLRTRGKLLNLHWQILGRPSKLSRVSGSVNPALDNITGVVNSTGLDSNFLDKLIKVVKNILEFRTDIVKWMSTKLICVLTIIHSFLKPQYGLCALDYLCLPLSFSLLLLSISISTV